MYVLKIFIYINNYPVFGIQGGKKNNFQYFYTNIEIAEKKEKLKNFC